MMQKNSIDLSGLRILITGAVGGIGAATARACAALGALELVLADKEPLANLCNELRDCGSSVTTFQCDVSQRQDNLELVTAAREIDAAVACAGICPLEEDWQDDPDWDQVFHRVMDVNLLGPMHLCRELLPSMEARGGGRIVLIGSIGGRMGGTSHRAAALHCLKGWCSCFCLVASATGSAPGYFGEWHRAWSNSNGYDFNHKLSKRTLPPRPDWHA